MTMTFHTMADFNVLLQRVIRTSEGTEVQPRNVNDHTITLGWGFTFLRKTGLSNAAGVPQWGIYDNLALCLDAIDVTLVPAENTRLASIRDRLNAGNLGGPTGADQLIADFAHAWNRADLTQDQARLLFEADMGFQMQCSQLTRT